jgi:hypothetical protein
MVVHIACAVARYSQCRRVKKLGEFKREYSTGTPPPFVARFYGSFIHATLPEGMNAFVLVVSRCLVYGATI